MREGKPLPYGVGCIGFVVRYMDSRGHKPYNVVHCGLSRFGNVVIDTFGAVASVFVQKFCRNVA